MRAAVLGVLIFVVAMAGATRTARAGSAAIFVPPLEMDFGAESGHGAALQPGGYQVLGGLHSASLAWWPTQFDVGVGLIGITRDLDRGFAVRGFNAGTATGNVDASLLTLDGEYVSIGHTVARGSHWRTWATVRGEHLHASGPNIDFYTYGVTGRLSSEVFAKALFTGNGGVIAGSIAIGAYIEVSRRDLPAELGPAGISTGITLRLPLILIGA